MLQISQRNLPFRRTPTRLLIRKLRTRPLYFTDNQNNFTMYGLKGYQVFHIRYVALFYVILCYAICPMLCNVMLFYCLTEQGWRGMTCCQRSDGHVTSQYKTYTFLCYVM